MAHERVFTRACLHVPDPDARVQTTGNHVNPIKLNIFMNINCFTSVTPTNVDTNY